jgi:hypothetical protein
MYEKNNNWNMFVENDMLFITKGADESYFLNEVDKTDVNSFFNLYKKNSLNELASNDKFKEVMKKLEAAGVIYKKHDISNKENIRIVVKYYGKPNKDLENRNREQFKQREKYRISSRLN